MMVNYKVCSGFLLSYKIGSIKVCSDVNFTIEEYVMTLLKNVFFSGDPEQKFDPVGPPETQK